MSNKKQTAVEWLIEQLTYAPDKHSDRLIGLREDTSVEDFCKQALSMEREQMIDFGMTQCTGRNPFADILRRQYEHKWNETYEKH